MPRLSILTPELLSQRALASLMVKSDKLLPYIARYLTPNIEQLDALWFTRIDAKSLQEIDKSFKSTFSKTYQDPNGPIPYFLPILLSRLFLAHSHVLASPNTIPDFIESLTNRIIQSDTLSGSLSQWPRFAPWRYFASQADQIPVWVNCFLQKNIPMDTLDIEHSSAHKLVLMSHFAYNEKLDLAKNIQYLGAPIHHRDSQTDVLAGAVQSYDSQNVQVFLHIGANPEHLVLLPPDTGISPPPQLMSVCQYALFLSNEPYISSNRRLTEALIISHSLLQEKVLKQSMDSHPKPLGTSVSSIKPRL